MSSGARVFLIDLQSGASGMQKALLAMGFQAAAGSVSQLDEVLAHSLPQVIVAPLDSFESIKQSLHGLPGAEGVLIFLLSKKPEISRAIPQGATAIVPDSIDGGVLGLRIKAATQTSIAPAIRQSAPPPAAAPIPQEAPLPDFSKLASPAAAPDSTAPPPPSISEAPVSSGSAVAFSVPPAPVVTETQPSKKGKTILLTAAAVVLLAGGSAFALMDRSGSSEAINASAEKSGIPAANSTAEATPASKQASSDKKPPSELGQGPSPDDSRTIDPKTDDSKPAEKEPAAPEPAQENDKEASLKNETAQAALPPPQAGAEAALFAINQPHQLDSCESMLGKSEADFANTVNWKSAHNWKLARNYLMAGKTTEAAKKMCESAFIDPRGPAVAGLVNYYLSERALEQAYIWAKKGVEANPKNRAAQEALGDVLNQMGRIDEAKAVWLQSFGLDDENDQRLQGVVRSYVTSARAASRGGALPLAERLLRRALSFDADNQDAATQFATVLRKNGQDELAAAWQKRAESL